MDHIRTWPSVPHLSAKLIHPLVSIWTYLRQPSLILIHRVIRDSYRPRSPFVLLHFEAHPAPKVSHVPRLSISAVHSSDYRCNIRGNLT